MEAAGLAHSTTSTVLSTNPLRIKPQRIFNFLFFQNQPYLSGEAINTGAPEFIASFWSMVSYEFFKCPLWLLFDSAGNWFGFWSLFFANSFSVISGERAGV